MEKYLDKSIPLEERKIIFKSKIDKLMNPKENFDPETFDPLEGSPEYEVGKRKRIKPPKELPTFGLKPKEIREGQMIGQYESKGDLYLIFAHRCNELQAEVNLLKKEIEELKKNK